MTAKQKIHQALLVEWAARFADQKASGLTVRQWCKQNHLTIHKYNYWKHLLKEEAVDQRLPDIVPVPVNVLSSVAASQPPSLPNPHGTDRAIRPNRTIFPTSNVRLCIDGVSLELDPAIPEDFLRTLIRAVHYA